MQPDWNSAIDQEVSYVLRTTSLFVLVAASALAEPLPVTLIWKAPKDCPQYEEVWARLFKRLGRAPATPDGSSFAARGQIVKVERGWRMELQTLSNSGAGRREFVNESCEELTKIAVVALSLAVDPQLEPPPKVTPSAGWLSLGPQTSFGVLPSAAAGLTLGVAVEWRSALFELFLESALPQQRTEGGRSMQLTPPFGGGLDGCIGGTIGRFAVRGCGVVRCSLLTGQALEVSEPRVGFGAVLAAGPRAHLRVALSEQVALSATLDATVSMLRPTFRYADGGEAWTPSLFSVAGALRVEFKAW